jgi:hypothetical protein
MPSDSANDVRARLQQELHRLLLETISSSPQLSDELVRQIVAQLEPQLRQQVSVTLEELQMETLVNAIVAKLPEKSETSGKRGAGLQFGSIGNLFLAVIAALGFAALVVTTILILQTHAFDTAPKEHREAAAVTSTTTIEEGSSMESAWRRTVSRIVEEQGGFYRAHAALLCGSGTAVVDCQSYTAARTNWVQATGAQLEELKLVEQMIVKVSGCRPTTDPAIVSAPASVTAIEACLATLSPASAG